ncbi:VolA/Pla-1 family phospholipase [Rheinheimera pleomorphica]|uniref:VolA/Pla-1 family phospholipase n=1 Tax=Rheinheimera pleomorphica TaxID=2703963 RepID=UPI00141FD506|nr:VolA/Pla-1 family phospholipase [Rheinheimera pleomorphica]
MNKLALSIAVALALGLTGCGGESLEEITQEEQGSIKPLSRVVFDPGAASPRLSVPNDLLFQGTTDGTLTTDSGDSPDYTNPQVALGALDGWSTQNPYTIAVDVAAGAELVASSVQQPGAVRLFEMVMQGPTSAVEECQTANQGFACQVVSELVFGQDYVTSVSGNNIVVVPLKPLKPATTYMTVLTSLIEDDNGQSLAPSTSYELVKQDDETLPLSTESQLALQKLINSFEDVLEAEGVDRGSIVYTAAMTTQSTDVVFNTLKQVIAQSASQRPLVVTDQGYNAGQALVQAGSIPVGQDNLTNPAYAAATTAKVYKGSVLLPYFSPVSTGENPDAALTGRWLAQYDSPVTLLGAIKAGLLDPALTGLTAEELQNPANLFGFDFDLDKARHITKFNPLPKVTELDNVPVLMTVPDLDQINLLRSLQQQDPITAPAGGWPVVIFQHGITSEKENMLAIAGTMAMAGYAVVAIDHMLHGERGFTVTVTNEEGAEEELVINATDNAATDYMNLQSLLTTRDNVRQSISDILALRAALYVSNLTQAGTINPTKVSFIGHSLGGIAGTSAIAMANTPVQNDKLEEEQKAEIDALFKVDTATLAMPGSAIANFLLDSARFGPVIKASVLFGVGGEEISTAFTQFATAQSGCGEPLVAPFAACYNAFEQFLLQQGQDATVAALYAGYNQFAFAAQTVIDSGDPSNYAQHLVETETPTYVIAVVGDGDANLPDQVIPNGFNSALQAAGAGKMPLAGTLPLARLLGAEQVGNVAGAFMPEGNTAISSYTAGDHGSILSPAASAAATQEMQRQTASFIVSGGAVIQVNNPAVLAPAN